MAKSALRHGSLSIALEQIDFQSRSFGDKLTILVSGIYDKFSEGSIRSKDLAASAEVKLIEDLILKEKGIKVKLIVNSMLAATLPFYYNKNFNLMEDFFRGHFVIDYQEKIIKEADNKKGYVDLKNAKVSGIFSEGPCMLYINFYALYRGYGLTAAETTAIMLHELGHDFAAFYFSDRFTRTNQVLAAASREIFKKNGKKNLDYLFKELKKVNEKVTIAEADAIINGDRIIAGVKWHKFLIDTVMSEMANDKYNDNSFEQLADSFAARHGYGKELVTGLDKLSIQSGAIDKFRSLRMINAAIDAIYYIITPFILISTFPLMPILTTIVAIIIAIGFVGEGEGHRDNTYDELKYRYQRIRNELVTMLKDESVSKDIVTQYVEHIKVIDKAIDGTENAWSLGRTLSNFLFSSNRDAKRSKEYQQTIESLVANDIFLQAAKLKTI